MIQRLQKLLVVLLAAVLVALGVTLFSCVYRGDTTLIRSLTLSHDIITPNADGDSDVTTITYELERNALVSIYLENVEDESRYYFRQEKPRSGREYTVNFSGVVDGYLLEGEQFEGELLARIVPDGLYNVVVEAMDESEYSMRLSEPLIIKEGDVTLPVIRDFDIVPTSFSDRWSEDSPVPFSPNRDGIGDRLDINLFINKDVEALRVYLVDDDDVQFPAVEMELDVPRNGRGSHAFDYSGGIDEGAVPPPDGVYDIVAYAEDEEGQKFQIVRQVELENGGIPRAEFVAPAELDTFRLNTTTLELCDTLLFSVTIRNYGTAPIRTTGPEPGTIYDSDWNYNTVDWPSESGAFRVAIGYETELKDYAYRWGLGTAENLTRIGEHLYLMPDQQVVVAGGIRIINELGRRNPQPFWAGLIHEDVEISQFNNRKDPHAITLDLPPDGTVIQCGDREIPERVDD